MNVFLQYLKPVKTFTGFAGSPLFVEVIKRSKLIFETQKTTHSVWILTEYLDSDFQYEINSDIKLDNSQILFFQVGDIWSLFVITTLVE